jgi:PE-PPE domain
MARIRSLFRLLFLLFVVAIAVLVAVPAWAAYVIYVQGTNSINPLMPNVPIDTIFNGSFNANNTVQYVSYPATAGLLSVLTYTGGYGLLPPTLNQSVAIGVQDLDAVIKADQAEDPKAQIYVIGVSQGAVVGTVEARALHGQGSSAYTNVTFILAGNLNRVAPSGGGISTQIPIPITIPGVLTVGGGVLSAPTPTNGPTIINVTNQGDPFANFSLANPLALLSGLANLLTGSPDPHDYTTTVLTPEMVTSGNYAPGYVVTKTGNLTDVFIPSTTPSPAPQLSVQLAPPVKTFQQVSASVQSNSSSPKLTLPTFPVAAAQPSMSAPKPVATQQGIKPGAMQQVTKPIRTERASTKPTDTERASTKPTHTERASTKPTHTERASTKPTDTERASTKPTHTERASTKPTHTERASTKLTHTARHLAGRRET